MPKDSRKSREGDPKSAASWQEQRETDANEPFASNSSDLPDRSAGVGGTGATPMIHAPEWQETGDAVPTVGQAPDANVSLEEEEPIRRHAYEIWEEEGRPEGAHERHWQEARRRIQTTRKFGEE